MEFDPEDQDIIHLLAKFRETEAKYPEELLTARRQSYLKRMGEIGLGVGTERGMEEMVRDIKTPNASPAASTLVETVLVVAILAEALTVTYFYRDKLANLVRTITAEARVLGVTPPPAVTTVLEIQAVTPSLALTSTIPSAATLSMPVEIPVTGTSTPVPGVVEDSLNNTSGLNLLNATPAPNELNGNQTNGDNHTNNGNHYGQTPKPERTKENGNNPPPQENDQEPPNDNSDNPPSENNNRSSQGNNDQPPRENNGHHEP